jgi:hypothetical protein
MSFIFMVVLRTRKRFTLKDVAAFKGLTVHAISVWPDRYIQAISLSLYIIIISLLQSTAGHRPLQCLAISLDLRLFASSSCQPSCANRRSTWPEDVLHYVYLDAVSTSELVYPSGCRFYGWYGHCHFSMLIRCAMSVTLVTLPDHPETIRWFDPAEKLRA